MTKSSIISLLQHVYDRQTSVGAVDSFRFINYYNGIQMVRAEYEDAAEDTRSTVNAVKQRQRRRKATRKMGLSAAALPTPHVAHSTPPPIDESNIDPSLRSSSHQNTGDNTENDIMVDGLQMQQLISQGYPTVQPFNGPNDGPPMYRVPKSAETLLRPRQHSPENAEDTPMPVTKSRPRPRPTAKVHFADDSTPRASEPRRSLRGMVDNNNTPIARNLRSQSSVTPRSANTRSSKRISRSKIGRS